MARKFKDDDFANLVKRLNELSNASPEQERQELLEAAKKEPRVLDDRQISLADIAKLAGIKEFKEPTKISPDAEKLIESITGEKSDITKAIEESDKSIAGKIIKEAKKVSNRLDKIAELEAKLAELKAEQKQEQTYDAKTFREVLQKDIQEYIKSCDESALVELYNNISDNEAVYNEESSNILVKTEETKEIIADAEKLEQEVIAEKEKEETKAEEVVQEYDDKEEKYSDTQIKQAFGILNDPRYKGGDYTGAVNTIEKLAKGLSSHPSVANALKKANEEITTELAPAEVSADEASGYQGETEPRELTFRARGDFRLDRPVDEKYAEAIKMELQAKGIKAEVEPDPTAYDGFIVHTLADPAAVEKALTELDFIESSAVPYKDQLSEEKK
jgi:chromosome segregation ATPase